MRRVSYQLRGTIEQVIDLEFHGTQEDAGRLIGAVTAWEPDVANHEVLGIQQRTPDEDDDGTADWVMYIRVQCAVGQFGGVVSHLTGIAGTLNLGVSAGSDETVGA
jgi:hypothetical protein